MDLPDDSFLSEDFSIVLGIINIKWDRVTPANNVSHAVALHPLKAAYFIFTSATIPYLAQEDRPILMDFTSAPEWGGILAQHELNWRFFPHFLDWVGFRVMTLPSTGIPLQS